MNRMLYIFIPMILFTSGVSGVKIDKEKELFDMSLQDLLNVEVSIATRSETKFWKTPSSVSFFTKSDIESLGIRTLTELLPYVPGFYSMMNSVEGNESYLVMRGHAQKYANTLLILLNGQRMNDDYTGGLNYLLRYFNLHNIKRIEVIRGPGSALYGSNAYNGVINIVTDNQSELMTEIGNMGIASLFWSDRISIGNWELDSSVNIYKDKGEHFSDIFDASGIQTTTQDPRVVEQFHLNLKQGNNSVNFHYLGSTRDDYYQFRRLRDGITELKLQHYSLYGLYQIINSSHWGVNVSAGFQKANRSSITALVAEGVAPFIDADLLFGVDFEYHSYNFSVDASYQFSENLNFNFGTFHSRSQVPGSYLRSNYDILNDLTYLKNIVTFNNPGQELVLDKSRIIQSGYIQGIWDINDQLSLTAGLRYDKYNDVNNAITPRFSLVKQINDQQGLKLIYGQGYRVPSLGDLYDEESGTTLGNVNLEASEITTRELVYYYKQNHLALTTTFFDNDQDNLIAFRTDQNNNSFLDNVAGNKARGIEFEASWQPYEKMIIKAALTHMINNDTYLGSVSDYPSSEELSPKTYMNYLIQYDHNPWQVSVSGTWRDNVKVLSDKNQLFLINSTIKYAVNNRWSLSFNIRNLTNKNYHTASYNVIGIGSDLQKIQEFPARGRQFSVQLTYNLEQ